MPTGSRSGGSMSLRQGLGAIPASMAAGLPVGVAVNDARVVAIERSTDGYHVHTRDHASVTARTVVLATPAYVTSTLTAGLDHELATLCAGIRYVSALNVAVSYPRDAVRDPLHGWGFVVPAGEGRCVRSVSWVSSKWPDRAPEGHVLIRASLGDARRGKYEDFCDEELIAWAHDDLSDLLEIRGAPTLARVYRLPRAMPQLEVGHLQRIKAVERRLSTLPGLFVSASGFKGVGLPDCIKNATAVAAQVAGHLDPSLEPAAQPQCG
jgi:oxygen-dependent protoporphyrinogen oxidase